MRIVVVAITLTMMPTVSLPDRKAGGECASKLSAASRAIYEATAASHTTPGHARAIVISYTEKLVSEGQLSGLEARPAGEAAGHCLELILK
jgi:hypothetical protein